MNIARDMVFACLLIGVVRAASATSIVYYNAGQLGTDEMQAALNSLGSGYTVTIAPSASAFQTDIGSGTYNMGIFLLNSGSASTYIGAINALGTLAAGGGEAIFSDMSESTSLDTQFGLSSYSSATNWTSMGNLGVLGTYLSGSTITLTNPGYATFSTGALSATSAHIIDGVISGTCCSPIIQNAAATVFWDGFADGAVTGSDGAQLYRNEILTATGQPLSPVPVPAAIWLLLSGLGGLGALARKNQAA